MACEAIVNLCRSSINFVVAYDLFAGCAFVVRCTTGWKCAVRHEFADGLQIGFIFGVSEMKKVPKI